MSNRPRNRPRNPRADCPCGEDHPRGEHPYAEAFRLMHYASDDGAEEQLVWNSRNGVTPFVITFPASRRQATHVRWAEDRYAPEHQPQPGDLVFTGPPESPRLITWPDTPS